MAKGKNVHVVPHQDKWAVKTEGASKPSSLHDTQSDAMDAGRKIAKNRHSELVIHRPDGTIRDKDSYGSDPHPPEDTKH